MASKKKYTKTTPVILPAVTNAKYAQSDAFGRLCLKFAVTATTRQASKFRMGKGLLQAKMKGLVAI